MQALPSDQIISSEDTKLHLPQNPSLRRTATSNQLGDGLCTANHNLSGLVFQPVCHPPYNLLILSLSHYFDQEDTIKDLGKSSAKVKVNNIHYSSLVNRISPPHNNQSIYQVHQGQFAHGKFMLPIVNHCLAVHELRNGLYEKKSSRRLRLEFLACSSLDPLSQPF